MKKLPKQEYTAEFKEQAVKRAQDVGIGLAARELGLVEQTPRNWVKAASAGKMNAAGAKPVTPEQTELSRLRAENARLKCTSKIQKKRRPISHRLFPGLLGHGCPGRPYRPLERIPPDGHAVLGTDLGTVRLRRIGHGLQEDPVCLVLGSAMKRVLFVLAGAFLFAVAGFVLGSVATNWYADHFAKSDDDINAAVLAALVAWLLLTLLGGYLGDLVVRRRRPGRGADGIS